MSTRNITKAYRLSTTTDRLEGEGWYDAAKAFAATLDTDVSRAVAVMAVISPMVSWNRNREIVRRLYDGDRSSMCLSSSMAKAIRILDHGEDPAVVMRGEKVVAFYNNIMGIDDGTVTIDRHAMMVAEGKRIPGRELKFTKTVNRKYAEEYRRAATILSKEFGRIITPAQVQATVWVWWRRGNSYRREEDL